MAEKQLIEFPIDEDRSIFVKAKISEDDEGEGEYQGHIEMAARISSK
jgi:hypothetical protein